jgi:hypothetical protein
MANKSKSVWAGWLDISAGIIWLFGDAFLFLIIIGLSVGFGAPHIFNILLILAIPALAGILAILGGVHSLKRTNSVLAIIGSTCAVPLGLGIIALVLIIQSRNVFN